MGHIPGTPTVMSVAFPSAVAGIDISAAGFLELSLPGPDPAAAAVVLSYAFAPAMAGPASSLAITFGPGWCSLVGRATAGSVDSAICM